MNTHPNPNVSEIDLHAFVVISAKGTVFAGTVDWSVNKGTRSNPMWKIHFTDENGLPREWDQREDGGFVVSVITPIEYVET